MSGVDRSYAARKVFAQQIRQIERTSDDARSLSFYLSDFQGNKGYPLPHGLVMTGRGIRVADLEPIRDTFPRNWPVKSRYVQNVPDPALAVREVKSRIHQLASNRQSYPRVFIGDSRRDLFIEHLGDFAQGAARVLTAPLWGPIWGLKKLVNAYAPN